MNRLGLAGRLILVLAIGLAVIQLLAAAAYLADRRKVAGDGPFLPFPDQIEAVVTLFDAAGPQERALLARAFTDSSLDVRVETDLPFSETPQPGEATGDVALPGLTDWLRRYSDTLGARDIRIAIPAPEVRGRILPRFRAFLNPDQVRIAIALSDGDWLVLQRQRVAGLAVGGLPVGMLSAILGALVAIIAIGTVWRETRPLRRLGTAATAFGRSLRPDPVPVAGAPDLRAVISAFNTMQDRVARMDRGRTDMIAALAHDVRTPLTRLRLRLRKLDPELQEAAARDIDDIAEVADGAFRFAAADLAELDRALDLRALLGELAVQGGAAFTDTPPGQRAMLRGNPELLTRAFANLVANAFQYATDCRIALRVAGDRAVVAVDDNGPGIPAADRARLLEPFERGEASRNRATGGSGLGLALASRIVARHGGDLLLGDAPGGGLRVTVTLPLSR